MRARYLSIGPNVFKSIFIYIIPTQSSFLRIFKAPLSILQYLLDTLYRVISHNYL